MHIDNNTMIMLAMAGLVMAMVYSQMKFKDKMLCYFLRPNKQRIEKFVPIHSKYVIFDRGKYGVGRYLIDPRCIVLQWWDRDLIHKLFPTLIPTMSFRWDTQYPENPESYEATFKSPELVNAAYQEHQQISFSKGAANQASGGKKQLPAWIYAAGALVIAVAVIWYLNKGMSAQIQSLANTVATKVK